MSHDVEPLETGVWLAQLRGLAAHLSRGDRDLAALLRRSFHLLKLVPRPLRHFVGSNTSEGEFEQLLETGAHLKAALALLGSGLNYTLSHTEKAGLVEAEVWFANECRGGSAIGPSPPAAIFEAWLECLMALDQDATFGEAPPSPPVPRRYQSGRRPRLTEH